MSVCGYVHIIHKNLNGLLHFYYFYIPFFLDWRTTSSTVFHSTFHSIMRSRFWTTLPIISHKGMCQSQALRRNFVLHVLELETMEIPAATTKLFHFPVPTKEKFNFRILIPLLLSSYNADIHNPTSIGRSQVSLAGIKGQGQISK